MPESLFESNLASLELIARGKVRDIYRVDDERLLIVATDRLSAFDVVLPDPIPGKGVVLTSISNFWFKKLEGVIPNHLTGIEPEEVLSDARDHAAVRKRAVVVEKLKPLPVEAVVRGYLIGSGWKDYCKSGAVSGVKLPSGLELAERLREPIFTPSTKAAAGEHDENISMDDVERLIGTQLTRQVREASLELYTRATEYARDRGIIIADTKFEFGLDATGALRVMDEVLTPDSSRFWPADTYKPGSSPPSFDKQYIRDYLETLDWNKQAPGPKLPRVVIERTRAKYAEALQRLTSEPAAGAGLAREPEPAMEFITRPIERRLWPRGPRSSDPAPLGLVAARFAYALIRDFVHGDLTLRAMSLVYTTMLAIVPLLAFAFAVLKGLGFHRELAAPILHGFLGPLGPRADELTEQIIGFVDNVNGSALASIGVALFLYTALSMAQKVESSFNFVWRVDWPRSFARRFSEYLTFLIVGPLIMSVAIGFTATLASTTAMTRLRATGVVGPLLEALSWVAPYALIIASFVLLYVIIPNTRVRLKPALIGGVFAGILWAGVGRLFTGFIVSMSRYEAIYAGFAIVLVAMVWLYLSWLILLLGTQLAFYVQHPEYLALGQRAPSASNATRERLALSAMLLVGKDFEKPGHGWRIESLAASLRVQRHLVEPIVTALMAAGLLTRTAEYRLVPARDLRRIGVSDILAAVRDSKHESHHETDEEWNATVQNVADDVERAIRDAVGSRTLADLVDADTRNAPAPS